MGRKYKFHDDRELYFVTFTVVHWIDVFTREIYRDIMYNSIKYCQQNKTLEIYAYCIMTNHIHMIIGSKINRLSDLVRDLKSFTSKHIRKAIVSNEMESRRSWMLHLMENEGLNNERNNDFQFWQQHNQPIELGNAQIFDQKLNYIHQNPVEAGFVDKEEEWLHSSAGDYYGVRKGKIELIME